MQLLQLLLRTAGWAVPLGVVAEDAGLAQVAGLGVKQVVAGVVGVVPVLLLLLQLARSGGRAVR
jgi:hypothetical protein